MFIAAKAFAGKEASAAVLRERGWEAMSVGRSNEWWSWCAGSGGVDGFDCVLASRIGRLVVAPALAGMQRAARTLKWCTVCRGRPA